MNKTKKKSAKKRTKRGAAAFIRKAPKSLTGPQVVAAGKKAGFTFAAAYVYQTRCRANRPTPKRKAKKR